MNEMNGPGRAVGRLLGRMLLWWLDLLAKLAGLVAAIVAIVAAAAGTVEAEHWYDVPQETVIQVGELTQAIGEVATFLGKLDANQLNALVDEGLRELQSEE